MKRLIKFINAIRAFLIVIAASILVDMFFLGARLKNWFVAANTSDVSPYSTDGQSNYITVLLLIIIAIIGGVAGKVLFKEVNPWEGHPAYIAPPKRSILPTLVFILVIIILLFTIAAIIYICLTDPSVLEPSNLTFFGGSL